MNCQHLRIRSKNYKKYYYCILNKQQIILKNCYNCIDKEYKSNKPIPTNKKKRTIATSISQDVKEIVWERDNHKCIFCHKNVPVECACCHYIRRSQGGMRN